MTRDEFMAIAEKEVEKIFESNKNGMMNLVARAWAEGKRNAETEELSRIVKEAIDRATPVLSITTPTWSPETYNDPNTPVTKEPDAVKPVVDVDTWKCGNCGHRLEHQEMLGDNILFYDQYE